MGFFFPFSFIFFFLFLNMPSPFQPPYAVPVPGAEKKDGETVPYRHFLFADNLVDHPEGVFTAWDLYEHGYKLAGGKLFDTVIKACF